MSAWQIGIFMLAVVASAHSSGAQSTQPAQLPLEDRANTAYAQGHYAQALPLLQELAGTLIDQPDRLGPVEERIRVCKRAIGAAGKRKPNQAATQPAVDLSAGRIPHPAPLPGQVVDLDINDLGNFNYDAQKGGNIPADVMRLDGAVFRTRGYMIPLDQAENITEFALVTTLPSGQPPLVQHTIVVHLAADKGMDYYPDELQVEGTLNVREEKDGGFIVSIFELKATSVKPLAK